MLLSSSSWVYQDFNITPYHNHNQSTILFCLTLDSSSWTFFPNVQHRLLSNRSIAFVVFQKVFSLLNSALLKKYQRISVFTTMSNPSHFTSPDNFQSIRITIQRYQLLINSSSPFSSYVFLDRAVNSLQNSSFKDRDLVFDLHSEWSSFESVQCS